MPYNIFFVLCLKRKWDIFNGNICSEIYTNACKIDFMTRLPIAECLVLAIFSDKHVFKRATMKWKLDTLSWMMLLKK